MHPLSAFNLSCRTVRVYTVEGIITQSSSAWGMVDTDSQSKWAWSPEVGVYSHVYYYYCNSPFPNPVFSTVMGRDTCMHA